MSILHEISICSPEIVYEIGQQRKCEIAMLPYIICNVVYIIMPLRVQSRGINGFCDELISTASLRGKCLRNILSYTA